jgi:Kef-type K+ transport system membrane component KefB
VRWVDQLAKGEFPVGLRFNDLDRLSVHLESLARLIAAATLLTGLLIGSAIAATTGGGDVALVVFVAATVVAAALVVVLLWRLVRPQGRRSARREHRR